MVNGKVSTKRIVIRGRQEPIKNPNLNHHRTRQTKRAFDTDHRSSVLRRQAAGQPISDQHGEPCKRTLRRWKERMRDDGHFLAYKHNGNKDAQVFTGHDLLLLCIYRLIYPEASSAEIIAFLFNTVGRFYSRSQVTLAEMKVGLSRKRASSTARQALQPRVQVWRTMFWNQPEPFGIANTPASDIIDFDEAVVSTFDAVRTQGKAFLTSRARMIGPFDRDKSTRVILAICGDPNFPFRYSKIDEASGTNLLDLWVFMNGLIDQLHALAPGRSFCFVMDNLNIHHNAAILQLIVMRGHRFVFRAPYHPVDGPIEYVFNTIENFLTSNMHEIHGNADVLRFIQDIIALHVEFSPYFTHVGLI